MHGQNPPPLPAYLQPCLTAIDRHAVISFDVFDTLLLRPTASPDHLFWLMEAEVQTLLKDPFFAFQPLRIAAEQEARLATTAEDITLTQIYEAFQRITQLDDAMIETIKQREIALELAQCFTHPHGKQLYDYALAKGKDIVFVSDMYLPQETLLALLEKNGFIAQPHTLFLSSETLKTKHHGSIYPHLLAALKRRATEILHIGDNGIADIQQARRHGLTAFRIHRHVEYFFHHKRHRQLWGNPAAIDNIATSLVVGRLAHYYGIHQATFTDHWHAFGYYIAGPLYLGFTQWLIQALQASSYDDVYFLARDGKIMKEVFDRLAPLYGMTLPAHYLYASRRVLQIARIRKLDALALFYLSVSGSTITLSECLERIGMEPANYRELAHEVGLNGMEQPITSTADLYKVHHFFRQIEPDILRYAAEERRRALGYYAQEGLCEKNRRQAIVDIGWSGMMVYALADLLERAPATLDGFFLGTNHLASRLQEEGFSIRSFLFEAGEPKESLEQLSPGLEIVELLFSATHGSVAGFKEENGQFQPVFDAIDCSKKRQEVIATLQQGALAFIDDMLPLVKQCTVPRHLALKPLGTILTRPTCREAKMFCHIAHIQDIAALHCDRLIVKAPPLSLWLRPRAFIAFYRNVYWKPGMQALLGPLLGSGLALALQWKRAIASDPRFSPIKAIAKRLLRRR